MEPVGVFLVLRLTLRPPKPRRRGRAAVLAPLTEAEAMWWGADSLATVEEYCPKHAEACELAFGVEERLEISPMSPSSHFRQTAPKKFANIL
jgi:hypothetical protein